MKKTLISVLLIVSLLSTALFSVVFAGYSVTDTKTAYAVVSAFGATVTVTTDFDGTTDPETSQPKKDIMTPGGSGTLVSLAATNAPNVAATITYWVENVTLGDWTVDSAFYCPIVFNVFGTEVKVGDTLASDTQDSGIDGFDGDGKISTAAELIAAIKAVTYTATAQADVSLTGAHDKTITWNWPKGNASASDTKLTAAATITIQANAKIEQN